MPLTIHPKLISTATPRRERNGLRRQSTPASRTSTPTMNRTARSHPSMVLDTTAVAIRIPPEKIRWTPKMTATTNSVMPGQNRATIPSATVATPKAIRRARICPETSSGADVSTLLPPRASDVLIGPPLCEGEPTGGAPCLMVKRPLSMLQPAVAQVNAVNQGLFKGGHARICRSVDLTCNVPAGHAQASASTPAQADGKDSQRLRVVMTHAAKANVGAWSVNDWSRIHGFLT